MLAYVCAMHKKIAHITVHAPLDFHPLQISYLRNPSCKHYHDKLSLCLVSFHRLTECYIIIIIMFPVLGISILELPTRPLKLPGTLSPFQRLSPASAKVWVAIVGP